MDEATITAELETAISMNAQDDILRFFRFKHLAETQAGVSMRFANMAIYVVNNVTRSPERTVTLRKLLEAKDAAVRCTIGMP